jgi:hypothetical protein
VEKVQKFLFALRCQPIFEIAVELDVIPGATLAKVVTVAVLARFIVSLLHTKLVELTNCSIWASKCQLLVLGCHIEV